MAHNRTARHTAILCLSLLLISCGNGEDTVSPGIGPQDSMTLVTDNGVPVVYSEPRVVADPAALPDLFGRDPDIAAHYDPLGDQTHISLSSGKTATGVINKPLAGTKAKTRLDGISYGIMNGTSVAVIGGTGTSSTYLVNEHIEIAFPGAASGVYSLASGSVSITYSRTTPTLSIIASSGTITVTAYGAAGERIDGVFSALTSSHSLSGSFSVTRENVAVPYQP